MSEVIERVGYGYEPFDYGEDTNEVEEFEESHKKRKLIALDVLRGWEKSRNSDRLLDWECLRTEFPEIQLTSSSENIIFKIPKKLIRFLPSPESYSRARRNLIQKASEDNNMELLKELMPTEKSVILKRIKREKAIRKYFSEYNQ